MMIGKMLGADFVGEEDATGRMAYFPIRIEYRPFSRAGGADVVSGVTTCPNGNLHLEQASHGQCCVFP